MAVPKKRTSKAKKRSRKAQWQRKAFFAAQKAFSLAKSCMATGSNSYVYPVRDSSL